jgi:hypothetical protein
VNQIFRKRFSGQWVVIIRNQILLVAENTSSWQPFCFKRILAAVPEVDSEADTGWGNGSHPAYPPARSANQKRRKILQPPIYTLWVLWYIVARCQMLIQGSNGMANSETGNRLI